MNNEKKDPVLEAVTACVNELLGKGYSIGDIGTALLYVSSSMASFTGIKLEQYREWSEKMFRHHMSVSGDYEEDVRNYAK